jgi:hypothetical protein
MIFCNKIYCFRRKINLAPVFLVYNTSPKIFYSTRVSSMQPVLFDFTHKEKFFKQRKRKLVKPQSERGIFANQFKLIQNYEGPITEEMEFLTDERGSLLFPGISHSMLMHTGQEYRPMRAGGFKSVPLVQRGYDYYRTYIRGEDIFFYEDAVFFFKKYKLGQYIFTKRTGSHMHFLKKKK